MKAIVSIAKRRARRSTGRTGVPVPILTILAVWGAIVAFWAPAYLGMLDHLGGNISARTEALEWLLLAIGASGLAGIGFIAWRDTRDPAWRAAHGLPQRPRSNASVQ